jgi:hypothetical protein
MFLFLLEFVFLLMIDELLRSFRSDDVKLHAMPRPLQLFVSLLILVPIDGQRNDEVRPLTVFPKSSLLIFAR